MWPYYDECHYYIEHKLKSNVLCFIYWLREIFVKALSWTHSSWVRFIKFAVFRRIVTLKYFKESVYCVHFSQKCLDINTGHFDNQRCIKLAEGVGIGVSLLSMQALRGRGGIASTHSWPRQDMRMSSQCHTLAALSPGKGTPVPIVQEAGWASELVWTQRLEEKSFTSARDLTLVIQSVVTHYTDWATPAPAGMCTVWIKIDFFFSWRCLPLHLQLFLCNVQYY
jgi:hypothetical protein